MVVGQVQLMEGKQALKNIIINFKSTDTKFCDEV